MNMNLKNKAGYSLIEVTLALLVAGVGLVAVFSLFPEGLKSSRGAVDAVEVSEFADYVFAMFQARASDTNVLWSDFKTDYLPQSPMIKDHNPEEILIDPSEAGPQLFVWRPDWYGGGFATYVEEYNVASFTYILNIQGVPGTVRPGANAKSVRLEVWPGDRVNILNANQQVPGSTVFYREFLPVQ